MVSVYLQDASVRNLLSVLRQVFAELAERETEESLAKGEEVARELMSRTAACRKSDTATKTA